MPEYNPDIHDPIIIDPQAFAFVQAYTDLDSDSFGNMYQSAIQAGYSHSYARVIGHYFPRQRIKKLIKNMQNPLGNALSQDLKENPESYSYRLSVRQQKRMKAEANRR